MLTAGFTVFGKLNQKQQKEFGMSQVLYLHYLILAYTTTT